jgi:hypothetical protein
MSGPWRRSAHLMFFIPLSTSSFFFPLLPLFYYKTPDDVTTTNHIPHATYCHPRHEDHGISHRGKQFDITTVTPSFDNMHDNDNSPSYAFTLPASLSLGLPKVHPFFCPYPDPGPLVHPRPPYQWHLPEALFLYLEDRR